MRFDCGDLERALAAPELLPEAREHARTCAACRRELWLWGEMSDLAPGLREEWETPDLWPRIREALATQQKADKPRRIDWRLLAAIAAVILMTSLVPDSDAFSVGSGAAARQSIPDRADAQRSRAERGGISRIDR